MDNRGRMLLNVFGVPEYVNNILNRALNICYDYECGEVNGATLLLAVVSSLKDKEEKIKHCNTTYSILVNSFEYKAGCGDYGHISRFSPDSVMTDYVMEIIHNALTMEDDNLPLNFLKALKETPDEALKDYLVHTNLDLEKLINMSDAEFEIPRHLSGFVSDTNKDVKDKNEHINNVDEYVDKLINILCRKTKKNPCLVGEAGVGKTSIVEALVQRINSGKVPSYLKNKHIISVNSSAMIGGTRYRGDFEERLNQLCKFASKHDVILFLDEIHTFMGLGKNGDDSQSVGNNIKSYLSDGSISVIGTTTPKEWHKCIEKDSALKRRIQDIIVNEPSIDCTIEMLRSSINNYTSFHNVKITDKAIVSAVKLSDRYMKLEKLPDKAFKIIDQACATVKIKNDLSISTDESLVNEHVIASVVSELTGIELSKLECSELDSLKNLEENIHKGLVGQQEAVSRVVKAVKRGKVGVANPNRPIASMLFVGPTGVGKTELCKILSEQVFNSKESFIRVDMSEFSAEFSTTKLIGSAPGYVGYGEGGGLTEKVKKHPYSLILLDEIEKANSKVFDSFLQVLDDGRLTDAEGQTVDFTNCIIVMTSNAGYGADSMNKNQIGIHYNNTDVKTYDEKEKIALKELESTFKPEFLNRIDNIIIFESITKEQSIEIAKLSLNKLATRLLEQNVKINYTCKLAKFIAEQGYSDKYGARNINRAVQNFVEDVVTEAIIDGTIVNGGEYTLDLVKNNVVIK